ncbi:RadC family protein [Parvularcula lutaonensis]|uniref:DNA repair protein RadC n=1 Tax=Parvularcula lutaonensis TaxID=491923 RepID=A0ABV7MFI8_9PROT|nr:DNA repair protein RadC [Parvularcula lutaonensis]GGY53635.1 DNA repair protein RadC [Parvularcula lutaonensis]
MSTTRLDAKSLQAGHRDRLRKRFMAGGADSVQDYELLELVLFNAIPRRDVKPLAKILIREFGNFADVINAPEERLRTISVAVDGKPPLKVSNRVLAEFALSRASALKLTSANLLNRDLMSSYKELIAYCRSATAYEPVEQFRILFLNNKNALIADEKQQTGTINHTPVYVREVIKRALTLNAAAIILVHNHPSGDPTPSRADIEMTARIVEAAKSVDLVVHDHLIIGRGSEVSFQQLKLM